MARPRIAVVGGGLAGLVAADRLLGNGFSVTVFEKWPAAGGLVGTLNVGGTPLERFYHHLFTTDVDYIDFAREFGLEKEIDWLPSKMGFYTGGRLWDFGTPASLLKFSPLGIAGRLQLVLSTLRLRHNPDWKALEGETAAGWLKKNGYGKVYDVVWGPLLQQKYGRYAEEIGLVWLWGKIFLRTRSRDKTGLGERLGYLRGSFGRGVAAVLARVTERGGEVRTARPVRIVRRTPDGTFDVDFPGGTERFDLVLSTIAIPELLKIASDLPGETRTLWSEIRYTHALCPILELDRSFHPYYWTNVADVTMPFGGVIEHTNYIPKENYGGRHVLYISDYVLPDDPKWTMRDEQLWGLYLPALARINPRFEADWILKKTIERAEYAQPIIPAGYSRLLPPLETPVPGLYSACMAQIYPEDRGQNYAVRIGREAAELLIRRHR
ncbi:MAG TPA: NAD(P)/FAD-dependent oxidoreductase [Thermoanaerobaculia bacterium]|nr:NAD(P)/FAD-dependent oxidoreductase [Thermoanaerobaculia bacterium]